MQGLRRWDQVVCQIHGPSRPLTVPQPSPPFSTTHSIVRVGDEFESGVLVSSPGVGAAPLTVTIKASVAAPSNASGPTAAAATATTAAAGPAAIRLLPEDPTSREVTLTAAAQQREVRFRFKALAVGAAGLRFDAFVGGGGAKSGSSSGSAGAADSAAFDVPVLARQGQVFLATSFALQGTPNGTAAAEGLALPAADPGSGAVELTAGVGNLPFVKATYESLVTPLLEAGAKPGDMLAADLVAAAALPALLARYGGAGGRASAARLNASRAAAEYVAKKLTDGELGLTYTDLSDSPPSWRPGGAAVALNGWALWLLGQAAAPTPRGAGGQQAGAAAAAEPALAALAPLQAAAPKWRAALARQVVRDAAYVRSLGPIPNYDAYGTQPRAGAGAAPAPAPRRYDDWEGLSWARLALGAGWAPDTGATAGEGATGAQCVLQKNKRCQGGQMGGFKWWPTQHTP